MPKTAKVSSNRVVSAGVNVETEKAWLDFEVTDGSLLKVILPEKHLPRLKLSIQQLQAESADKRRSAGLKVFEESYLQKIKQIEFGQDALHQVALIRTRFENGISQDTVLQKPQIRDAIQFLTSLLAEFEKDTGRHH